MRQILQDAALMGGAIPRQQESEEGNTEEGRENTVWRLYEASQENTGRG